MKADRLSRTLLIIGGFIELIIAILHFIWPFYFVCLPEFEKVPVQIKEFIMLASLALGLCMTIFAYFSFYFSERVKPENKTVIAFLLSQVSLWICRLILEFLFPVRVSLFSIENPSNIIIIGAIVIILTYLIPVFVLLVPRNIMLYLKK